MPTPMTMPRAHLFAMIAAALALALAAVAVIVVLGRGGGAAGVAVEDGTVTAAEILALHDHAVTTMAGGVSIAEAGALGVRKTDTIVAIAGRPIRDGNDFTALLTELALDGTTSSLFVEVLRGDAHVVLRRQLTGNLHDAWLALHPVPPVRVDPFASPDPTAGTPPDPALDAILAGITKVDDTHYDIDPKIAADVLANPTAVAKGARVVPAIKNGKPDGFKLYAIRPNSVYAKLGLTNGDTIQRINGFELTSADKALEVYTKVKTAKTLVVELTRRGKPLSLTYKFR